MPYLICKICNKYYKLKKGESPKDPQNFRFWDPENKVFYGFHTCECGNELEYYETMEDYLNGKRQGDSDYNADWGDIFNSWSNMGIEVKIIPIVVIALILTLIIAFSGALNIFDTSYAEVLPGDIKKVHKPVVVEISASWCSACQQFQADTLSNPQVQQKLNDKYVLLKIDVDENKELAKNFKTSVVPTVIILDSNYKEKRRYEGYMGPNQFLSIL